MASTFSPNLKIELIGVGDQTGVWGTTTNSNFVYTFEQAIVGGATVNFPTDADFTLTIANSTASPAQAAKAVWLKLTSTVALTTTRKLIIPAILKNYIIKNSTTGNQTITVTTNLASTTAVALLPGAQLFVYCDGSNVTLAFDYTLQGVFAAGTPSVTTAATTGFKLNSDSTNPIGVVQYPTSGVTTSSAIVWGSGAFNVISSTYILLDPTIASDAISINSNNIYLGGSKNTVTTVSLGPSTINRAVVTSAVSGSFPSITSTGPDTDIRLGITGKGAGAVAIGTSQANFILARGAASGSSPVLASGGADTNVNFVITGKGLGVITLGSNQANYLTVSGATASSAPAITATGSDTNINLVMVPKGTGAFYPVGFLPGSSGIAVATAAGATTSGVGTAGQSLNSNGAGRAPYWGTANVTGGQITKAVEPISSVTATASALAVDLSVASLFYVTNLTGATTLTINNAATAITSDNLVFSFSIISRQTATTAFINAVTVAGAVSTTLRWVVGVAPTIGSGPAAFDLYQMSIFRTATNTYTVLANRIGY